MWFVIPIISVRSITMSQTWIYFPCLSLVSNDSTVESCHPFAIYVFSTSYLNCWLLFQQCRCKTGSIWKLCKIMWFLKAWQDFEVSYQPRGHDRSQKLRCRRSVDLSHCVLLQLILFQYRHCWWHHFWVMSVTNIIFIIINRSYLQDSMT